LRQRLSRCREKCDGGVAISLWRRGEDAFEYCSTLASVTIPSSVTSIGAMAFTYCNLTNVIIPINVTSNVGGWPFPLAFEGCTNLTAFTVDPNNPVYSSVNGVLFDKSQTTLIQYPCGLAGNYTIPNSVTSFESNAFYCVSLTSVTIPNSVTNIGAYAFSGLASLTNVTIGTNVMSGNGGPSIGYEAFYSCTKLASVIIGNSVTSIGDCAFDSCTSLNNVMVGNGVTSIGFEAFYYCTNLTSVTIGNSVTNIGDEAFYNCTELTSVTIPNSVTSIGNCAFNDCTSLASVYFQGNAPSLGSDVFCSIIFLQYPHNFIYVYPNCYYLPGTTGWGTPGSTFGGCTNALWLLPNPTILNFEPNFGVRTNCFGFSISWATNIPVVVEACSMTNLTWVPLQTNTLTGGSCYFSDPQWMNYPVRCYRLRSP
jgi:hypothetical protein